MRGSRAARGRICTKYLTVIAFLAILGMIFFNELFTVDEKTHGGWNQGNRLENSVPDYDIVKDDYDILIESLLSQDADEKELNIPSWGKVLPTNIEETLPYYPIDMKPTDGSWQIVNGTSFKFFVFSAYYDRRNGAKKVRVIGATKTRGPERVWCRFWYANYHNGTRIRYTSTTMLAKVQIIRENYNLKYSACFVLCPIFAHDLDVPQYVSVVALLHAPPSNILEVRNTDWDADFTTSTSTRYPIVPTGDQIADKIAVCVKPIHYNYDKALNLIEYLEFYALMGVSHFTFYNHEIGPHATCVLQHYMSGDVPVANAEAAATNLKWGQQCRINTNYVKPTINILPWYLRMRSQKDIRTEGIFMALNDCVYRSMYRYKYLALVDLDEFIIPRHKDTLIELINSLGQNNTIGAYSFRNAFFYLIFNDDPLVYEEPEKSFNPRLRAALVTQRKTRRVIELNPHRQRSKYICKPEDVIEAGNHFIWQFLPGKHTLYVPAADGISHHYRMCENGKLDCITKPSTIDRNATKYADRLLQRVDAVYNYLKDPCNLSELPEPPAIRETSNRDTARS